MLDRVELKRLLSERKQLDINDPSVENYWDVLTEHLSKDASDTISYLNSCAEEDLYWLSEVFDEVSYNLQSKNFIICIEELDKKYPKAELTSDVESAKKMIE